MIYSKVRGELLLDAYMKQNRKAPGEAVRWCEVTIGSGNKIKIMKRLKARKKVR